MTNRQYPKASLTSIRIQAAIEALHALYGRSNMGNEDSHGLVCLIFEPDYLLALQNLYEWSIVGPDDVDEPKYLISKKLSEVPPSLILNVALHYLTEVTDGFLCCRVPGRRSLLERHYAPLGSASFLQFHDQHYAASELDRLYTRFTSLVQIAEHSKNWKL